MVKEALLRFFDVYGRTGFENVRIVVWWIDRPQFRVRRSRVEIPDTALGALHHVEPVIGRVVVLVLLHVVETAFLRRVAYWTARHFHFRDTVRHWPRIPA